MSHNTGDGTLLGSVTQNGGANNVLYTSNTTSGHFLGTVPRDWMLGATAGRGRPVAPNRDLMQSRSQTRLQIDTVSNTPVASPDTTTTQALGWDHTATLSARSQQYLTERPDSSMSEQSALTTVAPDHYDDIVYPSGSTFSGASSTEMNANSSYTFIANQDIFNSTPADIHGGPTFASGNHMPHASVRWTVPQALNGQASSSPVLYTGPSARSVPEHQATSFPFTELNNQTPVVTTRSPQQESGPMMTPAIGNRPVGKSTTFDDLIVIEETPILGATPDMSPWITPSITSTWSSTPIRSPDDSAPAGAYSVPYNLVTPSTTSQTDIPARLSQLDQLVAGVAAKQALTSADLSRIAWLRVACEKNDELYLMLHQLACIHNSYPSFIIFKLKLQQRHVQGLMLFSWIMNNHRNLSREFMSTFCNFPTLFSTFASDVNTQIRITSVKNFLGEFAPRWTELRIKVFKRGCPPNAREIAKEIGTNNPILGKRLFANFFYQLFPYPDNVFSQWCLGLFLNGQLFQLNEIQSRSYDEELNEFQKTFNNFARLRNQHPTTTFAPWDNSHAPLPINPPTTHVIRVHNQAANPRVQLINPALGTITNRPTLNLLWSPPNNTRMVPNVISPVITSGAHSIFPPMDYRTRVTVNPDPNCLALHQAHLRNPTLQVESHPDASREEIRFYSFLECYIGSPQIIHNGTVFETWKISVSGDILERKAKDHAPPEDNPFGKTNRIVRNDSIMFHLRCVQVRDANPNLNTAVDSSATTHWPANIFISVNGTDLEFRRKVHHGRDMPVDVTHLIHETSLEIQLSYFPANRETGQFFAVVLEAIRFLGHDATLQLPGSVDAQTSLATTIRPLQVETDDDDIVMADNHISIDLIDPFTAQIFDQPVRGESCRHRECFDLESYLQSRSCRNKDNVVHPDEWRCPICGKDARPSSLIIDQFLLQVKAKLIADNKPDTRAILVSRDGSWESKETVTEVVANNLESDTATTQRIPPSPPLAESKTVEQSPTSAQPVKSSAIEPLIYEIDDDEE